MFLKRKLIKISVAFFFLFFKFALTQVQPEIQPFPDINPSPEEFLPETQPSPEIQPSPEAQPEPEIQPPPEIPPSPEVQPGPEIQPSPEVQPGPEIQPSPEVQPSPDVQSEPEIQPSPEVQPGPEIQPSPEVQPSPDVQSEPEIQPSPEVQPSPEAQPEPEIQPSPDVQPSPEVQSEPEIQPSPETPVNMCSSITMTQIDGTISKSFIVDENVSFIITNTPNFYRSSDGGVTWSDQSKILPNLYSFVTPKSFPDFTRLLAVIPHPTFPNWVYIIGRSGKFWITSDGGNTYIQQFQNFEFLTIYPHPAIPSWILAVALSECCWNLQSISCRVNTCNFQLLLSTDGGLTWESKLTSSYYGLPVTWANSGTPGGSNTTVYYIIHSDSGYSYLGKTTDLFITQKVIVPNTIALLYLPDTQQLLIGVDINNKFTLQVTSDGGESFVKSDIPQITEDLHPTSYQILDYSNGSVYVGVRFNSESRVFIYTSDLIGSAFSLDLSNVRISIDQKIPDFYSIGTLDGIYIANQYINYTSTTDVKSVITWTKGAVWWPLEPPSNENCSGCSLNLLGNYDFSPYRIFSSREYAGVIIANGNVGTHQYTDDGTNTNLYLSSDAGKTWTRILNGSKIFSITKNLIVAGSILTSDNPIWFSHDTGTTFDSCYLSTSSQTINRISTGYGKSPDSAWIQTSDSSGYYLYYVNLSFPIPNCGPDDYESYSPRSNLSPCLLGANIHYTRKKISQKCVPDPNLLISEIAAPCNCTRDDYFCTYCFVPDPITFECVLNRENPTCVSLSDPSPPPLNCTFGDTYLGSPKYRRVTGNLCTNDIPGYLDPREIPCPPTPPEPEPELESEPEPGRNSTNTSTNITSTPTITTAGTSFSSSTSGNTILPSPGIPTSVGNFDSATAQNLQPWMIVLIVFVVIFLLAILLAVVFAVFRRRRRHLKFAKFGDEEVEMK